MNNQIASYLINISNNYEAIIDSIETMDGYIHFTTNESMFIQLNRFPTTTITLNQHEEYFIKMNFKLSFIVWTEIERFNNGNELINIVVDFHNVHNIFLNTNYPFQKQTDLLEFIDSIPAHENDVVNMVFDECVDQWDEPFGVLHVTMVPDFF